MFNSDHWILIAAWTGFCVLHSILAATGVKEKIERITGRNFVYYRPVYSVFAFISLGFVLYLQFSTDSFLLWRQPSFIIILIIPFLLLAIYIMGVSISKYFLYLSGVDVFIKKTVESVLQTDGLHRFVRHPLYFGTLLLVWCIFFLFPYLNNLIACVIITGYTLIGIFFEEKKLLREYGDQYKKYAENVPMLIPGLKRK